VKPRLLDLFSGAGGAAMGYRRAGFEIVGVDIKPQPRYPFEFIQADALAVLRGGPWVADGWAAIHASPPCQAYTTLRHRTRGEYADLIGIVREELIATGLPYVIENVEGAPLRNPLRLCGSSFGLGVNGRELRRHRRFETSFPVMAPPCQHVKEVVGVYGTGGGGQMTRGFKARGVVEAREALGTPWMTLAECAQAVPPAMTEHIGHYLVAEINARKVVA
jgi:DNA (cytosine-5)-methyltransferase 1